MITKQEKIKTINDMIATPLNVGDEYQGDVWIEKVFIGDVISWIENEGENKFPWPESAEEAGKLYSRMRDYVNNYISQLLNLWTKKQLPIEDQSDKCIEFIYTLIS